ncbi:hypothetical protein SAMN07250955_10610 [Arboricoccus pini]|uniref:Uncharacterized protein n=1 Tax=Arboricoccus pini TaxID=1963835 RepID=A0A212R665_9PROT|nr:hypothetical protein [Arboricoccus pini]SNB67640.1 hypothetical protein SAMN07250955_10610 [Arboricoccus pini]
MIPQRPVVLVEDHLNDVELRLTAPGKINLANSIIVLRDGAEALNDHQARRPYRDRESGDSAVILVNIKLPAIGCHDLELSAFVVEPVELTAFLSTIEEFSLFQGVMNTLPPRGRHAV